MMLLDESSVKIWLNYVQKFLDIYQWLGESFVLDHFVDSHWEKLPSSWRSYLTQLSHHELGDWISAAQTSHSSPNTSYVRIPAPLSLQCFRKAALVLSLNRTCQQDKDVKNVLVDPVVDERTLKLLNRHVKKKKQHEILRLSNEIQELSSKCGNIKNLIDIGSGLGHLVRFMSYGLGFNTIGIDADPKLAMTAKILNEEIEKKINSVEVPSIQHLHKFLTSTDKICHETKFGIAGLHSCGDLGGTVIQNFVINEEIQFLCFVSCCYMKINDCFPMSAFLKQNQLSLKYESLELACHAKELYVERLQDTTHVHKLKVHCYRATLETLLVKRGLVRTGLKSVKDAHLLDFREYAERATQNLDVKFSDGELDNESISKMLSEWMLVVIFYTLRILLAPVIETCLLLDRALFILENGIHCEIKPIFNAVLSPRNLVIIGLKEH